MTVLLVAHPKGGVGRSTTAYWLAYELARLWPERVVGLHDADPAGHLSRVVELYPPGLLNVRLVAAPRADRGDLVLVDTAPEPNYESLRLLLDAADWLLIPVKGPEAGSVQVLPAFLRWLAETGSPCRLLGFLPTMWKGRRLDARRWLAELDALVDRYGGHVFAPIPDTAALAAWRADRHPYADLARAVAEVVRDPVQLLAESVRSMGVTP